MASARDIALIGILLFAFGLLFFVVNFATKTMVAHIIEIPAIADTSPAAVQAFEDMEISVNRFDYMSLGLFIGLMFALIISGYYVGGEPIFMFFYFLITTVSVFISMGLSNFWYNMTNSSVFGITLLSFPITNHILMNLPYYVTGCGVLGMVVMFAKPYVRGELG